MDIVSAKKSATIGALVFLVVGGISASLVVLGLFRTNLYLDDLWPGDTLATFFKEVAAYLIFVSFIWAVPALRKTVRGIALSALLLILACGAGLGGLSATLLLLGSSLALGDLLTGASTDLRRDETWAAALVAVVVGLGLWSIVAWTCVHFPINYPQVYLSVLAVPLILNRWGLRTFWSALQTWLDDEEQGQDSATGFMLGTVSFGLLLIQLIVSMWPEAGYDGLAVHLRTAVVANQRHLFPFDVHEHAAALMPYFSDWLFSIAYQIGGEPAAKLTNGSFMALTLLGAWGLVRQYAGPTWAKLAAMIVAATPLLLATTATLFAENYLTLAAIALLVALDRTRTSATSRRWRHDAGLAVLMAIPPLVKPYGWLLTLAGFAAWSVAAARDGRRREFLLRATFVGGVALILGILPYAQAWILTGNPLFPFYNAVFRSPLLPAVNVSDDRWVGHLTPDILYRMTFASSEFGECNAGALGMHYLILVPCLLAAPLVVRSRIVVTGFLFVVLYGGGVLILAQYLRYQAPLLPVVVVVGLIGVAQVADPRPWLRRTALVLFLALSAVDLVLLPAGFWILWGLPLQAAFIEPAKHDLIEDYCPMRLAMPLINHSYGASSRVAFLGTTPFAADLLGTPMYRGWFNRPFDADASNVHTPAEAAALVSKWRLTHAVWKDDISSSLGEAMSAVATSRQEVYGVTIVTFGNPPLASDSTGISMSAISATDQDDGRKSPANQSRTSSAGTATIQASPNPLPRGTGPGKTSIRWNTGNATWGQVFVSLDGGADSKMIAEGASGVFDVDWIYPGHDYEFRLFAGKEHAQLLAKVNVSRKGQ